MSTTTTNEIEPHYEVGTVVECIDNVDANELYLGSLYRVICTVVGRRNFIHVEPLDPAIGPIKESWSYRPSRFRRAVAGAKWGDQFPVPPPTTKRCLRCRGTLHWGGAHLWHDKGVAKYAEAAGAGVTAETLEEMRRIDRDLCKGAEFVPMSLEDLAARRPDAQAVREAADGTKTITIPVDEYTRLVEHAGLWQAIEAAIKEARGGK